MAALQSNISSSLLPFFVCLLGLLCRVHLNPAHQLVMFSAEPRLTWTDDNIDPYPKVAWYPKPQAYLYLPQSENIVQVHIRNSFFPVATHSLKHLKEVPLALNVEWPLPLIWWCLLKNSMKSNGTEPEWPEYILKCSCHFWHSVFKLIFRSFKIHVQISANYSVDTNPLESPWFKVKLN